MISYIRLSGAVFCLKDIAILTKHRSSPLYPWAQLCHLHSASPRYPQMIHHTVEYDGGGQTPLYAVPCCLYQRDPLPMITGDVALR